MAQGPRPAQPQQDPATSRVPRLHVLTQDAVGDDAIAAVRSVVAAGAPLVQVRLKSVGDGAALDHVRRAVEAAHAAGATCLVDDRVDVAMAAGADGVHLGADDLPVPVVRALTDGHRPRFLVGGTARDPETARRLADEGVDYLGVGPCFPTGSKTGLPEPGGPARVAAVADAVEVPVVAIGGVTAEEVPALLDAGAHGVAVIGAVWHAPDPATAVRDLLAALGGRS